MTIGMVWSAGVFFNAGIVVMGTVRVTTLHPRRSGDLELPNAWGGAALIGGILESGVQRRWPIVYHSYKNGAWVPLIGRKTQTAKAIDDELQATEMNGFAWSEANAGQVVAIDD
jgi:hypothetical protein